MDYNKSNSKNSMCDYKTIMGTKSRQNGSFVEDSFMQKY